MDLGSLEQHSLGFQFVDFSRITRMDWGHIYTFFALGELMWRAPSLQLPWKVACTDQADGRTNGWLHQNCNLEDLLNLRSTAVELITNFESHFDITKKSTSNSHFLPEEIYEVYTPTSNEIWSMQENLEEDLEDEPEEDGDIRSMEENLEGLEDGEDLEDEPEEDGDIWSMQGSLEVLEDEDGEDIEDEPEEYEVEENVEDEEEDIPYLTKEFRECNVSCYIYRDTWYFSSATSVC